MYADLYTENENTLYLHRLLYCLYVHCCCFCCATATANGMVAMTMTATRRTTLEATKQLEGRKKI